ncbi:hypothetical protein GOP47_0016677 [Adiantum capillus-veneris]|uniref:Uncharacterized protein n=1 Tax=Adiantum capillus-veneris TaxID=13818 RepID=A0A9D4ZBY3_ADICA|nr:hypothetical protein GOP47_0016677 [Adiantum capillus-veneris]
MLCGLTGSSPSLQLNRIATAITTGSCGLIAIPELQLTLIIELIAIPEPASAQQLTLIIGLITIPKPDHPTRQLLASRSITRQLPHRAVMEQVLTSGGYSLKVIFSTPERDPGNNLQNAKHVSRGGDGPAKKQIVDGLGIIRIVCSKIQASCEREEASQVSYTESIHRLSHSQYEQGIYLHRLEERMQLQINGILHQ